MDFMRRTRAHLVVNHSRGSGGGQDNGDDNGSDDNGSCDNDRGRTDAMSRTRVSAVNHKSVLHAHTMATTCEI